MVNGFAANESTHQMTPAYCEVNGCEVLRHMIHPSSVRNDANTGFVAEKVTSSTPSCFGGICGELLVAGLNVDPANVS